MVTNADGEPASEIACNQNEGSDGMEPSKPMEELPSQISAILSEIRNCIDNRQYYTAILTIVTLPEVCVGLTLDLEIPIRIKHYREFIERYASRDIGLNGDDFYRLRCGVVHRGSAVGHVSSKARKILFLVPEQNLQFHGIHFKDGDLVAVCLSLGMVFEEMERAVHRWYGENKGKAILLQNLRDMLSFQKDALRPFLGPEHPDMPALVSGPFWR